MCHQGGWQKCTLEKKVPNTTPRAIVPVSSNHIQKYFHIFSFSINCLILSKNFNFRAKIRIACENSEKHFFFAKLESCGELLSVQNCLFLWHPLFAIEMANIENVLLCLFLVQFKKKISTVPYFV